MNKYARWLSAFSAITHLIIGLADPLSAPLNLPFPRFLPPSWQVIYMVLPSGFDWIYPALWIATGIVAMSGVWRVDALRWGFRMSSLLFLSWAIAGIPAMTLGLGGNIQGVSANLFIAGLAWLSHYNVGVAERSDKIDVGIAKITDQITRPDGT